MGKVGRKLRGIGTMSKFGKIFIKIIIFPWVLAFAILVIPLEIIKNIADIYERSFNGN
jgi:hypothetical protein